MGYLIDTSFLVRRWRGGKKSVEERFLREHADDTLQMPWIVKGEFLRGVALAGHAAEAVAAFLDEFPTLWPTERTLLLYAETFAALVRSNGLIGPNDLWIAAAALEHRVPLVTRNVEEFRRVADLVVVDYAKTDE